MNTLEDHYAQMLGLTPPWKVERVKLNPEKQKVDLFLRFGPGKGICPECGATCPLYDCAPVRTWRHLDTMQFETFLHCEPPRVECADHGIRSMQLPWAAKHSRFTLLFEQFAISVIEACRSLADAGKLLRLSWHRIQSIINRAVERGLERREKEEMAWIGMDEKSFRKGHDYISLMNDLEGARVLDVVEGREGNAADKLITQALDAAQREMVCGVCIDMSAPYIKAIRKHLPNADIVHDKFHVSQHLNQAVDQVRRQEHRKLLKEKDDRLTGSKYLWLAGMEHLSDEALEQRERLVKMDLKVARAWHLKELFRHFWSRRDATFARDFFEYWVEQVYKSGLAPMKKVARMLRKHLEQLLTYYDSYITNAFSEGINSKIQALKANARGFRSFKNYRARILFFCGKLDLYPLKYT